MGISSRSFAESLAGCSREQQDSGEWRQAVEKEGGDVHTELHLKCWQLLCLASVPRAPGVSKAGAGGSRAGGQRAGVWYRKGFGSRQREQRTVGALELDRSEG